MAPLSRRIPVIQRLLVDISSPQHLVDSQHHRRSLAINRHQRVTINHPVATNSPLLVDMAQRQDMVDHRHRHRVQCTGVLHHRQVPLVMVRHQQVRLLMAHLRQVRPAMAHHQQVRPVMAHHRQVHRVMAHRLNSNRQLDSTNLHHSSSRMHHSREHLLNHHLPAPCPLLPWLACHSATLQIHLLTRKRRCVHVIFMKEILLATSIAMVTQLI